MTTIAQRMRAAADSLDRAAEYHPSIDVDEQLTAEARALRSTADALEAVERELATEDSVYLIKLADRIRGEVA